MKTTYNVGDRVQIGESRGDFPLADNQLTGTVMEVIVGDDNRVGYEIAMDNVSKEEALAMIPPIIVVLLGRDGSTLLFTEDEIAGKVGEVLAPPADEFQVGDRVRIVGGGYTLKPEQMEGVVESVNGKHRGRIEVTIDNYPHEVVAMLFGKEDNRHLLSFHSHELVKLETE